MLGVLWRTPRLHYRSQARLEWILSWGACCFTKLFPVHRPVLIVCCAEYERRSSSSVDRTLSREQSFIPAHAVKSESWCRRCATRTCKKAHVRPRGLRRKARRGGQKARPTTRASSLYFLVLILSTGAAFEAVARATTVGPWRGSRRRTRKHALSGVDEHKCALGCRELSRRSCFTSRLRSLPGRSQVCVRVCALSKYLRLQQSPTPGEFFEATVIKHKHSIA